MNGILEILGLKGYDQPPYQRIGKLRYQLFHRTASAIQEAKRIGATKTLVLVQSFKHDPKSYKDFKEFLNILSIAEPINKHKLLGPVAIDGIKLYFVWLDYSIQPVGEKQLF